MTCLHLRPEEFSSNQNSGNADVYHRNGRWGSTATVVEAHLQWPSRLVISV